MTCTKLFRYPLVISCALVLGACAGNSKNVAESERAPVESQAEPESLKLVLPEIPAEPVDDPKLRLQAEQDYVLALGLMRNGKNKHAIDILQAFVNTYPAYSGPYANLGILYHKSGDLESAEKAFKRAVALKPDHALAYNRLGMLYREQGDFEKAREAYEKAIEADNDYPDAHMNLGILYDIYLRNERKAIKYYSRYQDIVDGRDEQVAIWVSDLQRRSQQLSQAVEE